MKNKLVVFLGIVLILAVGLSACQPQTVPVTVIPTEVPEVGNADGETVNDEVDDDVIPLATVTPTSDTGNGLVEPTATLALLPTTEPPPAKEGFVATNPATVNLGSGTPQLVEFYAVW